MFRTYYTMKINRNTGKGSQVTTNYHNAKAYKMTPESELVQRVITCYWNEPKFYEKGEVTATAIIELIQKVAKRNPEFILQLAKTIRNPPFNMRTIAIVMWVEAGLNNDVRQLRDESGRSLVTAYAPSIIKRTDELTEALAYIIQEVGEIGSNGQGSIPAALKRGLANAFDNFDDYQFAKYRGNGDVKLKDVIKLVRPKPRAITLRGKAYSKSYRSELYGNIKNELLRQDDTWEAILSEEGRSAASWNKVIAMGNKFPIMAALRNVRNVMQVGANLDPILARFNDESTILKSRQHSYRFYSAWKMIEAERHVNSPMVMEALENAIEISAGNLPQLGGTTCVAVDNSGSMRQVLSKESIIQAADVGNFLGAVAHHISDKSHVISYGSEAIPVVLSKNNTIINNMEKIARAGSGSSTLTWKVVQHLIDNNIRVDRIINLTDMQGYDQVGYAWGYDRTNIKSLEDLITEYRAKVNPDVWVYSINLTGYGTVETRPSHPRNIHLAGWSAQLLNYIRDNEADMTTFIQDVKAVKP